MTNDVLKTIYNRRSIRDYQKKDVPDDALNEIINAGTYAPSTMNREPWRFVVIKDRNLMKKYSDIAKESWLSKSEIKNARDPDLIKLRNEVSKDEHNIFYDAPALVLIFSTTASPNPMLECALAAENMMLAARSMDIGSCWIGVAMALRGNEELKRELEVPEEYSFQAAITFGYPTSWDLRAPARNKDVILKWVK